MSNTPPSQFLQFVTQTAPPSVALIAQWPSQGKLHQSSSLIRTYLLSSKLLRKIVKI